MSDVEQRRRRRRRTERNLPSEIMTDSKAGTIGKFTTNWLLSRKQFIIGLLHPGRLNVSKVNQYGLHISKSAYTCFEFLGVVTASPVATPEFRKPF